MDAAAIANSDAAAPVVTLTGETMGTSWRVLYAAPPGLAESTVRQAVTERLDGLVAEMSHWLPSSHLCAFNRAEAGSWVSLPPDFARVIDTALRVAAMSGGAFDPAAGRLVDAWGFGPPGACPPPDDRTIAAALSAGGWRRLRWDAEAGRLFQPGGVSLDLSGIAKGYGVDAVGDTLSRLGVRHRLVEVGGELAGTGVRPDGDPWWVDLEDPPGCATAPIRVALHGIAVATSGRYVRGDHSLDPRTGRPPVNDVVSVSVLASSAMLADALATAITVLFPDLSSLAPLAPAARVVTVSGGKAAEHLTPALRAMLD